MYRFISLFLFILFAEPAAAETLRPGTEAWAVAERLACFSNQGADLPAKGAPVPPSDPNEPSCNAAARDGKVCEAFEFETPEELACLKRELALWDKAADRLVIDASDHPRRKGAGAAMKAAVAAFRAHRAATAAAIAAVVVNDRSPSIALQARLQATIAWVDDMQTAMSSP